MPIDIKKLLIKKRLAVLIDEMVKLTGSIVAIINATGEVLYGEKIHDPAAKRHPMHISGEILCWLVTTDKTNVIIPLLTHIINSEIDKINLIDEMLYRYKEINLFYTISEKLALSKNIREISDNTLEEAVKITKCTSAAVLLFNENTKSLECISKSGDDYAWRAIINYHISCGEKVFENPEIINDVSGDNRFGKPDERIRSIICVPLKLNDDPIGIITLSNSTEHIYNVNDLKLLRLLALHASSVIKSTRSFDELNASLVEIVSLFIETVESIETKGHSGRVSEYSMEIGKQLGMSPKDLIILKFTALLHDIGKIKTDESNYKDHPHNSVKTIEQVKRLKHITPGIKHHHENFDGTGFPDGLKGQNIPLNARIIAVADAFEHSSHVLKISISDSLESIFEGANTLYDSDIVAALVKAYEKKI